MADNKSLFAALDLESLDGEANELRRRAEALTQIARGLRALRDDGSSPVPARWRQTCIDTVGSLLFSERREWSTGELRSHAMGLGHTSKSVDRALRALLDRGVARRPRYGWWEATAE